MSRAALLLPLALLLVAAAPAARAQEVAVDGDYRVHDVVYVKGLAEPLQGTILQGREPGASTLVIRLVSGIVHELKRADVARIVDRETPASAFRARARALASSEDAALHRRLAEWGLGFGLRLEAEDELRRAARAERDPERAVSHRERLVGVQLERAQELDGPALDAVLEAVLAESAAPPSSPLLRLAHARVLLELGLPDAALPPLEAAAARLAERAGTAAAAEATPGGSSSEPAAGSAPESAGSTAGGGAPRPPRVFRGDGEALPEPEGGARGGGTASAPTPAAEEDHSAALLPALSPEERALYREVLRTLGAAALAVERRPLARSSYERLLAIWPQDAEANLGAARVLAGQGDLAAASARVSRALELAPTDPELLLARGHLHRLAGALPAARADLEAALRAEPADALTPRGRQARAALALVLLQQGDFETARLFAEQADGPPGSGVARLVRGLLAELSGDLPTAAVHYEEAARLLAPREGEAHYTRAFALAKGGDAAGAAAALEASVAAGFDFELATRSLINLAQGLGRAADEAQLTELLVRGTSDPSPRLLAALGRVQLAQRRHDEARRLFTRGLEREPDHLGCLRGLAYLAYVEDDRAGARALFERVLKLSADDAWAEQGLRSLEEARTRRVWTDGFDRAGPDVLGGWTVEASFGVDVRLQDGDLRFEGAQANAAEGRTRVARSVSGEQVVKLEAVFRPSELNAARFGIRFEAGSHKVVLWAAGGRVRASVAAGGGGAWAAPIDLGPWPGVSAHALAIDVTDPAKGTVALLVDGERRGELTLGGVGRGRGPVEVALYVQGDALGERASVSVEEVRVYVHREPGARPSGGF